MIFFYAMLHKTMSVGSATRSSKINKGFENLVGSSVLSDGPVYNIQSKDFILQFYDVTSVIKIIVFEVKYLLCF